ncbi:MAG: DNA mismatch repair protein MutS [Planctomycetota bacterium]|jgi:DNA mismatch repair protein MutS
MALTAMMEQYNRIKRQCGDAILFFRMGDFYEMFYDDAKTASRVLGLALTSRAKGENAVPMAGVPHHSASEYLRKLVDAGHNVAICEQVEDPTTAKGLVRREITRIVTAGTVTEENLLEDKKPNYLAAIAPGKGGWGLAWADVSTGAFLVEELPAAQLEDELFRLQPAECLVPEGFLKRETEPAERLESVLSGRFTPRTDYSFSPDEAARLLEKHFGVSTLDGFGLSGLKAGIGAAGAVFEYLRETQKGALSHLLKIVRVEPEGRLILDRSAQASLELVRTQREGRTEGSLLWVLDRTLTPMGGRLLRDWVTAPLSDTAAINRRLDAVEQLVRDGQLRARLRERLSEVADLERIAARLSNETARPYELVLLAASAEALPAVRDTAGGLSCDLAAEIVDRIDILDDMRALVRSAIVDRPPSNPREGGLIRAGYDDELDRLRSISRDGRKWIAEYQAREIERTGIENLKVGYNRVFGYYIQVTNANRDKVPTDYIRKQTLKNAERYVTPELREYEAQVLSAQERSSQLEFEIFTDMRSRLGADAGRLQSVAAALAQLDVLASLAEVAEANRYTRPEVNDTREIAIEAGKHPVLDVVLADRFVPNDLSLGLEGCDLAVVTGPNMAGKSTYIRQAALLVVMAQMGSFIPARRASIGAADRVFARVGASDELARGQSTFMVEMTETANILNNAGERSLVVLDEVGRGTSTFDGLSLAWSVCEQLAGSVRARTLFATHYHELTELALVLDNVKNFNVRVSEWEGHVTFHHEIVEGGTDKSYGIYVAKLAGVPAEVVERAKSILARLEAQSVDGEDRPSFVPREEGSREAQFGLFASHDTKILEELLGIDLENLTPVEALLRLRDLQQKVGPTGATR